MKQVRHGTPKSIKGADASNIWVQLDRSALILPATYF